MRRSIVSLVVILGLLLAFSVTVACKQPAPEPQPEEVAAPAEEAPAPAEEVGETPEGEAEAPEEDVKEQEPAPVE